MTWQLWPDDMPVIHLAAEPTEVSLTADALFDGPDLDRFIEAGGSIHMNGHRVYIQGGSAAGALMAMHNAGASGVLKKKT